MKEEFLHHIWQFKLYKKDNLKTTCGNQIEVIHPGEPNQHAGPDFFNAKIKFGDTLWVGNIEVHICSSEWKDHKHHLDKAYDNVILHVVEDNNATTRRTTGDLIPVLELSYPDDILNQYQSLIKSNHWMACREKIGELNSFEISLWLQRVLVERLEYKMNDIQRILKATTKNWDETFYRYLFRSFGFGVNADPFEMLAQSIPLKIILKYCDNLKLVEALLFGQAGFLEHEYQDDYINQLRKDYSFLKHKHQLSGIEVHVWKFLRLRPSNFPTVRLAQLAQLLVKLKGVFGKLINEQDINQIKDYLNIDVSSYWKRHYIFQKESSYSSKKLGESSKDLLIINTIVPYLFAYGKINGDDKYISQSFYWLSQLKPEKNSILNSWNEKEIEIKNAGDSQALIYLSNYYCKLKKCLRCRIGHKILTIKIVSEARSPISR